MEFCVADLDCRQEQGIEVNQGQPFFKKLSLEGVDACNSLNMGREHSLFDGFFNCVNAERF